MAEPRQVVVGYTVMGTPRPTEGKDKITSTRRSVKLSRRYHVRAAAERFKELLDRDPTTAIEYEKTFVSEDLKIETS